MLDEIRNIKSGNRELRSFAVVMAVALAVLGLLLLWKGRDYYLYFLVGAGAFMAIGLVVPVVLWPLHKIWMTAAVVLGWLMTRVILGILYYLVITPTSLLGRLFGKRFLDLKIDRSATSYWIKREDRPSEPADLERQY